MRRHVKLKEIATISAGQSAPQGDDKYSENGIPFIKAGNLADLVNGTVEDSLLKVPDVVATAHNLKLYPKGTIVFAKSGMSCMKGYVYILQSDCYVVNHLACVIPQNILGQYLKYYLEFNQPNRLIKDSAYPSISLKDIGEMALCLHNEQEQANIIKQFDNVYEFIAICNQLTSLLDNIVKSRFVEMFGDILCNDKGWPIYTLDTISSSRLGKMLDAKRNTGKNSFPYLANFNVQWFEFDLSELHEIDFDDAEREEFSLNDGDLLITEGGEVGRCAIWHNEVTNCYFQKALHRVRCDKNVILPEYLAWWFKFHSDFNGFEDIVGGKATIAHLPGVKLKKLQIEVPDINVQKDFVSFWREIDKSKLVCSHMVLYIEILLRKERIL